MPEEKIIFYSGKQKRVGVLNKASKNRCVVLAHGFLSSKEYFNNVVEIFSSHDIASFRFDFVGHGESEGSSLEITLSKEIEDMKAAIDFVKTEGYKSIGIIGHSLGATISILGWSEEVNCLVALNPVISLKSTFLKFFDNEKLRELERKGYITIVTKKKERIEISDKFFEEVMKFDSIEIKKVKCPMLFIVSSQDETMSQAKEAFLKANEPKKLEIIPDADHNLSLSSHKTYAFETAAIWLKKWLG